MKKLFNLVFGLLTALSPYANAESPRQTSSRAPQTIAWLSEESKLRFERSDKTDFYPLANNFEAQINKFYCGPASAVIALNTLRMNNSKIKKPIDMALYRGSLTTLPSKEFIPVFERYTQDAFFNEKTDLIKKRSRVFGEPANPSKPEEKDFGLQLHQLFFMLKTYGLDVESRVVSEELDEKQIRKEIIENLKTAGDYVIVNYARKALGQTGGGHISPLAAYDAASDSVLIMDVNPSHQPWVWVTLTDLVAAMRTKDTVENRGYLLMSELAN